MKTFAPILALVLAMNAWSQDMPPRAQLVDEFGPEQCDAFRSRIENLAIQMRNNPVSPAYVILSQNVGSVGRMNLFKKLAVHRLTQLRFDADLYKIIQARNPREMNRFWLVPPGASPPAVESTSWPDSKLDLSKRIRFGTESQDNVCPTFFVDDYADILRMHPDLRAHIVIYPNSRINRMGMATEWLKTLDDLKVPRRQVRLFFRRPTDWPRAEFWIVPQKHLKKVSN